jgi:hypothetical protein
MARGRGALEADVAPSVADPWDRWTAVADERLVLAAIERAPDTWLTAERIAAACGLPLERVQTVLDTTPSDVIVAPVEEPALPPRYSTRAHYRATRSILRRYLDALLAS